MVPMIFKAPNQYIQGPGVMADAGSYIRGIGDSALLIADEMVASVIGPTLERSLDREGVRVERGSFGGECSNQEIERLGRKGSSVGANIVIGAGGGKALDAAKVVGANNECKVVLMPTIAATDAPTSSIAVIYGEDHSHEGFIQLSRSPDLILVDTQVIAEAPVRFLVAGMGDALGTRFETEACYRCGGKNIPGYKQTVTALALSRLCYDLLIENGLRAKWSAEKKLVTPALEKIVEANILLSGLGFESGGLAAAHAVQVGFTHSKNALKTYHGEKVALGVLVQLFMEDRPTDEIEEVVDFNISVGLPVTLEDLLVQDKEIPLIAEEACKSGVMKNMPFEVTPRCVADSILLADEQGKASKKRSSGAAGR